MPEDRILNHLKEETSPYLQQHKRYPVDWYPWGEKALNKTKTEDRICIKSL